MVTDSSIPDEISFAIAEYRGLWNEHGIEDTALKFRALPGTGTVREPKASASATAATRPANLSSLDDVRSWIGDCRRCGLCEQRNQIVFGAGAAKAKLMFVGEGPGADEDAQGAPFVGRAGELLTKIIDAMGFTRDSVYIANVVKCRPPENRAPLPEETTQCLPFLKAQVDIVSPTIIVALGGTATAALTGTTSPMSSVRGRFHPAAWKPELPVMPTYHPAYLLRNPAAKKAVWDDIKQVMARLGESR